MFGLYRTLLALMVVLHHLGELNELGRYAVFAFYIISGYLMTLILHVNYDYSLSGLRRYAINRFLRIYPAYWVACVTSLCLIVFLGKHTSTGYHSRIFFPSDLVSLIQNTLIIFVSSSQPRLIPPAWTLTVELAFYIAIGLGLSKTKWLTTVWFGLSMIYTIFLNVCGFDWQHKYLSIMAASLPFSTGALIYHYRDITLGHLKVLTHSATPILLFCLVLVNYVVNNALGLLVSACFYVNYLLSSFIVLSLTKKQSLPLISLRLDKWFGDLSYPIYLMHYNVGLLIVSTGLGIEAHRIAHALICLPFIILVAGVLNRFIERPIENFRKRIRAARNIKEGFTSVWYVDWLQKLSLILGRYPS
jgi:peptidoglycan/LPS O-acetylase OafA/YrhL